MMRSILLAFSGFLFSAAYGLSQPPTLKILQSGKTSNLRGLSSIDGTTIWVSGSNGLIGLSTDSGQTWTWQRPDGYANRDFRDIASLGDFTAVTIGIDTPAIILKTKDGGLNWTTVYQNNHAGMFLDALDFRDPKNGIVVGDPVDGQIFLAKTSNGGDSWLPFTTKMKDRTADGEAFFAASGSNIHLDRRGHFLLPSGGARSRLWKSAGRPTPLPFQQGNPSAGPNAMAVKGDIIAIVGGDYTQPSTGDRAFAISYDRGRHWQSYHRLPGYGSGIAIISDSVLVACGLNGVWLTKSGGRQWETIDSRPFNAVLYLPRLKKLYLAGPKGTIAVIGGL